MTHSDQRDRGLRVVHEHWPMLRSLFDQAAVPAAVIDPAGRYRMLNESFAALVGRPVEGLVGHSFTGATHPDDVAEAVALLARLHAGEVTSGRVETRYLRPGGEEVCVALHCVTVVADSEQLVLCQAIDITEQRRVEQLLAHEATHDPLTGVVTRPVFMDFVGRALAGLPRTNGMHVVALFLDLDRLKYVNDTYGHGAGDAVITEFADRLRRTVRPADVVARIGGDEFAALLEGVQNPCEAGEVAQRILEALAEPFDFGGRRIEIRASIGVAVSATERTSAETLLAHADAAMYRAKERGRGRFELFDDDAYAAALTRQRLEDELRSAVANDQLLLHYQPILDLATDNVTAVEALLRWDHPTRGIVAASDFIAIAEECDLLRPLTGWLVRSACRQLAAWDADLGPSAPQQMYLNIAVSQLADHQLVGLLTAAMEETGVQADRLNLEITETQMFADPVATAAIVGELRSLGCKLVVDDFGTGYSSLSRLTELPVSALKIDRSFVHQLAHNREAAAIAASVVLLAHNLRHIVIAEGVETADQLTAVTELGCDLAQGYLIAPGLPADDLRDLLTARALGRR